MPGNMRLLNEPSPAEFVATHYADLASLADESMFLAAVVQIPPLADSDDAQWNDYDAWNDVYRLLAAAKVVGLRGWRSGVLPIFERVALGDLNETMESIRHGPEQAFSNDSDAFLDLLEPLTAHARAGTRQWSVDELGIYGELRSLPFILGAVHDPVDLVRDAARGSLRRLARHHPAAAAALADLD